MRYVCLIHCSLSALLLFWTHRAVLTHLLCLFMTIPAYQVANSRAL